MNRQQNTQVTVTKMTGESVNKKMRKGFTLIEIVFVAVLIALLAGLVIPKVLDNAKTSEYMSTLQQDLQSVKSAIGQYKTAGGQISDGFDTSKLSDYLASSFVDTGDKTDRGFPLYADKNGDIIRFSADYDGSPEFIVSLKDWDNVSSELKTKMLHKIQRDLNCDDGNVDDNAKVIKATSCHY